MLLTDIPMLIEIEGDVNPAPWKEISFIGGLEAGHIGLVSEQDGGVQGFAILSIVDDEASLLNIAVKPEFQSLGIGYKLLQALVEIGKREGVSRFILEVRESNTKAISFYEKAGFCFIARRKAYYSVPEGREDALIYQFELNTGRDSNENCRN
jgi:ribosomal-protein-alanine N-acetyltransferase